MDLVLFDCDGTLVDSQAVIVAAMSAAFGSEGLPIPAPAQVRRIVGLSLPLAIAQLLAERPDAPVARVAAAYKDAYRDLVGTAARHEPLFDGMREALDRLRSRPATLLGIVTGKSRRGLVRILQQHGIDALFVTLQTADDAPSKPDPTMVLNALAETGAQPARTVVVGDTAFDIAMARAAGTAALGVAWGYHPPSDLIAAGAAALADTPGDIPTLIEAALTVRG